MVDEANSDFELTLQTLNYATRMLASELDHGRLRDHALDTLADFGRSSHIALLHVNDEAQTVEVDGRLSSGTWSNPDHCLSYVDNPLADVIASRQMSAHPLSAEETVPWPAGPGEAVAGRECFCVPLIGRHRHTMAVATLERDAADPLSELDRQVLTVVATLIAAAMDNARLFHLATVDGLTGLYVRRFFEIRLSEELARLRRFGGTVGLLITDIDHFKAFNDTYGHQTGDLVLRQLADLAKLTVRQGIDVPCRYGGEEYVFILPETDLAGAVGLAERLRRAVAEHTFGSADRPLQVTISGGVTSVARDDSVDEPELVRRADEALYHAKESGRNRVMVWSAE